MIPMVETEPQHTVSEESEYGIGKKAYFWFSILTLVYLLDMADRNMLGAIYPALKEEMGFSDSQLGMIGAAVQLAIVLLIVPCGYLVDKWSRTKTSSIMAIVWSIATWATSFATSFKQLFCIRFVVGAGEAGYNPAGYALISAWFPQKIRGMMTGIFSLAQPLGGFLGMGVAGYIAQHYGWRNIFGFFAVPGIILGILLWFAPDYKTKTMKVENKSNEGDFKGGEIKPSLVDTARHLFKSNTLIFLVFSMMAASAWGASFAMWAPSFFGRIYHLNMAEASQVVMFCGIFAALGPIIGGIISDKMFKRWLTGRVTTIIIFLGLSLLFWCAALVGSNMGMPLKPVAVLWAVGNFMMAAQWGVVVVVMMELVPPQYRGTLVGLTTLVTYFFAAAGGFGLGSLSDLLGLTNALIAMISLCLGSSILFLLLSLRTFKTDYQKIAALGKISLD